MSVAFALCAFAAAEAEGACVSEHQKLDPILLQLSERAASDGDGDVVVDVVISLDRSADEAELASLAALGLSVNSVIGDILTGSVPLRRLDALAAHPSIVKIEGSAPLSYEGPPLD